ncbi:hypothetical protein ALC57_13312 [Trachymyrmex cornetzi]|uniref:THAP-type domain-containing protein n=1 Tax=Trachymyrmex cornetzi TaxID=471704 RepID=A0A151IZE7_9HYME|nr:hypothetical protein ALC57_13312 [Trachymyrmex cornetzi]
MSCCAVEGCTNHSRKTNKMPGKKVQYFSFPKDIAIAAKWHNVCAKQDDSVIKGIICSIHFESSCFEKSLQQQLLGYSPVKVRKLRSDAIPTLYLCNESPIVTNIPSLIAVKELDTLYIDNVPEVDSIVNATPITSTATTDLCSRADDVNSIQNLQWELAEMKKKLQKYDEKEKLDRSVIIPCYFLSVMFAIFVYTCFI